METGGPSTLHRYFKVEIADAVSSSEQSMHLVRPMRETVCMWPALSE